MPTLSLMKGVILAAGKGTRLYPVTRHIPKPLIPMANRMTLEYAFDQLKQCDITHICIVAGENRELLQSALGDGSRFGVRLTYVVQDNPKGLAHAVGCAQEFVGGDDFLLYLGDAVYSEPFNKHVQRFKESGCANLNLVKPVEDPRRFGVANVDGEKITKLVEKPQVPESNLAMAGMYIFGPQIWSVLPELKPSARGEFEITDAIQTMIEQGETVLAGVYEGSWFDTGTLDSFLETTSFLTGGHTLVGEGATVEGEIGEKVVIGEGSTVHCVKIEDSVVLPGSTVNIDGSVTHSILGGHVTSPSDLASVIRWDDDIS